MYYRQLQRLRLRQQQKAGGKTAPLPMPKWQQLIWAGVGLSLLLTILALFFLIAYVLWRVTNTFTGDAARDLGFVFSSTGLVTLSLMRYLAIMIGAAIAFAGLAVSFFAHENATTITTEGKINDSATAKMALATHSPGIVALMVGAAIIIFALYSKAQYEYKSQGGAAPTATNATTTEPQYPTSAELEVQEKLKAQDKKP